MTRRSRSAKAMAAGTGVILLLVSSGCSQDRAGILRPLPDPVFTSATAPRPQPAPTLDYRPIPEPAPALRLARPWLPPGGLSGRWDCIVIHHSASDSGGAAAFDEYHRNTCGWDELGYHFVIGNGTDTPDGRIEVGSRWAKQKHGAHCKTADNYYNDHGIGVCLVGDFEHSRPTAAQMESLEKLTRFLLEECDIPVDRVLTHKGVTGRTACPGRRFPLETLKRHLSVPVAASAGYR